MTQKSILIIGAGVAGLCTGIYGQMNGYKTHIIEMHKIPGGLVTAWRRKGYKVDLCVHFLTGSGPGMHLHRYWKEVGLLEGRSFVNYVRHGAYHARDGRVVVFYCDPERLEQHLLELAPQDEPVIRDLIDGVRLAIRFNPPEMEQYEASTLGWMKVGLKMMPLLKEYQRWSKMTVGELVNRFQSPLLREAFLSYWQADFSVFYMILSSLGFIQRKQAGYPLGGSLPLALCLENRYGQLGGTVQYRTRVNKILVEGSQAVGVQLEDGSELHTDIVVSAADGYSTIFELLEGKFTDEKINEIYEKWAPFQSVLYVGAGVNRTFPQIVPGVEGNAFELRQPVMIAGDEHKTLGMRIHNEDAHMAPPGKTVLTSAIYTRYEFWKALQGNRQTYETEKENVARVYVEALEQIWPGISAQVEMVNVATPLTFERFTGNWKGSITGWKLTPHQAMAKIPKNLPGLENFWMVGQWVYPGGGLPGGVSTAREVIWHQCKKDKRSFTTQ